MKPKVALLTSMVDFSPGYSLNGVILDHARMLKRAGWTYDLLVLKHFNRHDLDTARAEGINVKNVLPQTTLIDYPANEGPRPTTDTQVGFEEQVQRHAHGYDGAAGYLEALEPYDTICSHDLMFLSWHLPQNAALRQAIDKWPEKNWLHWVHSGPSMAPSDVCYPSTLRYSSAANSVYVFLNETQRHDCALMLGTTHDKIAVVYNSRDPRDLYGFSQETNDLIDAYDLLNSEVLQIYPFSTARWHAKGVHRLCGFFGAWKDMGIKVKLVLVNAHANSACDEDYVRAIEKAAQSCGLDVDKDVVITSRWAEAWQAGAKKSGDKAAEREAKEWRHCVPHRVVRELTMIANMFVFPSESECCSLIQAEAAQSGKFMILNSAFPAMAEFATEGTLSFDLTHNDPEDNWPFFECAAREAWSKLQTETAVLNMTRARTTVYNRDWIWRRQLEPLLWRKFSEKTTARANPNREKASRADSRRYPDAGARDVLSSVAREAVIVAPTQVDPDCKWDPEIKCVTNPARAVDYRDPQPGDVCPIYGACSEERKAGCYAQAGHCLVLDEIVVEK